MQIRIPTRDDLPKIWDLCKSHDFTEEGITEENFKEFVNSLYFENPLSKHYQIVVEEGNQIIGHEGVIPFSYRFYGKDLNLGFGSNLIVHEKFRSMLAFLQMQNYFFKNYSKLGIDFTYGLVTRKDVLAIHLKTGYKKIVDIPVYAKPLKVKKILNRFLKNSLLKSLFAPFLFIPDFLISLSLGFAVSSKILVKEEEVFKPEWDPVIKKHTDLFSVAGVRNSKILNWRFKNLSYRKYYVFSAYNNGEYCGYIVLRQMNMQEFSSLAIVDLLCDYRETKVFDALMYKTHQLAKQLKVDLVSTISNPNSNFLSLFQKKGFWKTPEYFTLVADQPKDSPIVFPQNLGKDWHINWFDHDYI